MNTSQQESKLNPRRIRKNVSRPHTSSQTIFTSRGCFLLCGFHMGGELPGSAPRPFHSYPESKGEEARPQGAGGAFSTPGNLHQLYTGGGAALVPELLAKQSVRMSSLLWSKLLFLSKGLQAYCYLSAVSHMPLESLSIDFNFLSLNHKP